MVEKRKIQPKRDQGPERIPFATYAVITVVVVCAILAAFFAGARQLSNSSSDFDAADFPSDAEEFVQQCFDNDQLVVRIDQDDNSMGCSEEGVAFYRSDRQVECYASGDDDWSQSACPKKLLVGSVKEVVKKCGQTTVIDDETDGIIFCVLDRADTVPVTPNAKVTCYHADKLPAETKECPGYIELMQLGVDVQAVGSCDQELVFVNLKTGEMYCTNTGPEGIPIPLNSDTPVVCGDPTTLAAIDCPMDELTFEPYEDDTLNTQGPTVSAA